MLKIGRTEENEEKRKRIINAIVMVREMEVKEKERKA